MAYPTSNKIAYPVSGKAFIVRDNSDYVVNFEFDSEWDVYADMAKTARFAFGGGYVDVPFTGNSVNVPIISKGREVNIGVFAGNLSTTTPASFPLLPSIRSKGGAPIEPESSVYDKIMALIKSGGVDPEVIANAVETYLAEHPIAETDPTVPAWAKAATKPTYTASEVGAISQDDLQSATNAALAQAKASGEFKGDKGDTGVQGIQGIQGIKGDTGEKGADGTSVTVASVTESTADGGNNVVTFSDGKTVTIKNGTKGSTGAKGDKGNTGATGATGADGYTPVKGTDYWTAADKSEMVDDVLAALPTWTGGSY